MPENQRAMAERMVRTALDVAAYILEQRHKGKPVYVDWIDHPELTELACNQSRHPTRRKGD